ncbi:helix-turn-helix domain-containing protein [Agrobacterium pusense]|jgi:DNA-binding CsgD family transcriptional regulator|uniref:helix-turn-helix domain-containing protein n=1 Tax=Agrobacterium pusense TaxID=648995 RepID=UPI000DE0907C|nr:helix-turn-helix domain-containing protein [Agrobacterium pusense]
MQEIDKETRLTRREKEVLLWAAKGKTAWETAVILNISRTTVLSHLKNARIKLDTTNVAQTIAEAISRSEIPS